MLNKKATTLYKQPKRKYKYASVILIVLLLVLIIAIVGFDKHSNKAFVPRSKPKIASSTIKQKLIATVPYDGWKTYCSKSILACIRYPADWTENTGLSGTFINPTQTTEVSLIPLTEQDDSPNFAYIYSVDSLMTSPTTLSAVGYIVSDQPGYVVLDSSYVASKDITPGTNRDIIDGNYAFNAKQGTASLVATPYAVGYNSINNLAQAKAWFESADGQTDLRIIESLYYQ